MVPVSQNIYNSLSRRLRIALQEHYMVPILICLFILSLFIPFKGLNFSSTIQVSYLSLVVVALLFVLIRYLIKDESPQWDLEILLLLVFAVNVIIRFTGGVESSFLPLYLLLIIAASYYCKFVVTMIAVGMVFSLHMPWIELLEHRRLHLPYLPKLLIIIGFLIVTAGLVKIISWSQGRRYNRLANEIARIKSSLDQVDSSLEEATLSSLSAEEQLSLAASFITEMDRILKDILALIRKHLGAYSAILWQLHHPTRQLLIRSYDTLSQHFTSEVALELDHGLITRVVQKGPLIFKAKRAFPSEEQKYYLRKENILSIAAAPLKEKEDFIGILAIDGKSQDAFTNQQLLLLSHFAQHIVDIITLYRQARSREQQTQEIRAFYQAAQKLVSYINLGDIMDQLIKLARQIADFNAFALVLLTRDQLHYILKRVEGFNAIVKDSIIANDSNTWLSWFLRNQREPLVISNFADENIELPLLSPNEGNLAIASFVALSLRVKDRLLGALIIGGKQKGQFSGNQARMLSILCSQASLALENALIHQRIGRLAITDGLTELYNHRYFQESLNREITRQERIKGKFSLLLLDIDDFKKLNDRYGHQAGDLVLKGISAILKSEAREADVLARYGGEEFALLLLDTDKKGSIKMGDRICRAVGEQEFKFGKKIERITISGGIACWPTDAQEKQLLIRRADRALYYSKEKGKNRISHISQVKA